MKKLLLVCFLLAGCTTPGPTDFLEYYDDPAPINFIDPLRFQRNLRDCRSAPHCAAEDLFNIAQEKDYVDKTNV